VRADKLSLCVDALRFALLDSVLPMNESGSHALHENLDTAYVNLAALLRYLQGREFVGRVHVQLVEYEADIYLSAQEPPRVRERDHTTGQTAEGEEALQRLLVRACEAGGLVSVYAGEEETNNGAHHLPLPLPDTGIDFGLEQEIELTPEEQEWRDLLRVSGEVVAAVERAALSANADFGELFQAARLELSDDYAFLDPLAGRFEYSSGGHIRLHAQPSANAYVSSITEALRRVVAKIATGERGGRLRERVALELAVLARRRQTQLARFKLLQQFDRIAGTRVL
jgi:hypothetical protein